ncbi:hypothetical protein RIF29_20344 [Crotalaria pallida]|uniref:Uncharacterized protein n=1 Tax=Crotalaria pallida TaxID=3830 RepID=A0AAN9F2D1_CROPI
MNGNKSSVGLRRSKRKRVFLDDGEAENTSNAHFSSNGNSVVEGYQSVGQSSCRRRIAFRNSLLGNVPISVTGIDSGEFRSNATIQNNALQDITNQLPSVSGMITPQRNESNVLQDISAHNGVCFANSRENAHMTLISEVGKQSLIDSNHVSEVPAVRVMNTTQRKQNHVFQDSRNDSEVCLCNSRDSEDITLKCDIGKHNLLDVQLATQASHYQYCDRQLSGFRGSSNDFSSTQIEHYILKSRGQVQKKMSTLPDSIEESSCMCTPLLWNNVGRNTVYDYAGLDQTVEVPYQLASCSAPISPRKVQKVSTGGVNQIVCDLSKDNMDAQGACVGACHHDTYRDKDAIGTSGCVTNLHNLHSPLSPVKGRRFHYRSLKKIILEISERSTKDTKVGVQPINTVKPVRRKRQECAVPTENVKVVKGVCLIRKANEDVLGNKSDQKIDEASISGQVNRRGVVVGSVSEDPVQVVKRRMNCMRI